MIPLLIEGQGEQEATEKKRTLGLSKWLSIVSKAVDVVIAQQLGDYGGHRSKASGVSGRNSVTDPWQQQSGVDPHVPRGTLPAAIGVETIG